MKIIQITKIYYSQNKEKKKKKQLIHSGQNLIQTRHDYNYTIATHMKNSNQKKIEESEIFLLIRTFTFCTIKTFYWSNSKIDIMPPPSKVI